jgi:histone-binding protein RBBP4
MNSANLLPEVKTKQSSSGTDHLLLRSRYNAYALRDLTKYSSTSKVLHPTRTYTHHTAIVNDVQYHSKHAALIGTVSDDLTLQIIDLRQSEATGSALKASGGHSDAINALSFNPASEYILATGSADSMICIWDMRNLKMKLHTLAGHQDCVTSLAWHPFEESILGSASNDRRVIFWDLSKVGEEQAPEDAEDGPPELYVHEASNKTKRLTKADYLCMVVTLIASQTSVGT